MTGVFQNGLAGGKMGMIRRGERFSRGFGLKQQGLFERFVAIENSKFNMSVLLGQDPRIKSFMRNGL